MLEIDSKLYFKVNKFLKESLTVFSAPNYCDQIGNKAAVCMVQATRGMAPKFISYSAVPHPDVKPMAFAGASMGMFGL